MKFTVDRATWWRGDWSGSRLLRNDGNRCCIGFVGQQCGIPDEDLVGMGALRPESKPQIPTQLMTAEGWIGQAYGINDAPMDDSERESELVALFAKNGHEIEFIGEGNPAKAVTHERNRLQILRPVPRHRPLNKPLHVLRPAQVSRGDEAA